MGRTQSWITSRLRIKCFSLGSWVDLNRNVGKHFESWSQFDLIPMEAAWAMSRSESIPGEFAWVVSWFWFNSRKADWVLSWIHSSLRDTAWVMSWLKAISREDTWVESQKRTSYQVNTCVESPKRSYEVEWNGAQFQGKLDYIYMHIESRVVIIESWVDSNQYFRKNWVVSRFESKSYKAFWDVSCFESKLWKAFWVVNRF